MKEIKKDLFLNKSGRIFLKTEWLASHFNGIFLRMDSWNCILECPGEVREFSVQKKGRAVRVVLECVRLDETVEITNRYRSKILKSNGNGL